MAKLYEHPVTIVLITILFGVLLYSLRQTGNKTKQSTAQISQLEEETYNLSIEVQDLQQELEYSKRSEYKEKIIRDQLLLQKPGEYVVQLALPDVIENDDEIMTQDARSNQEKWLEILF